MKNIVLCDLDGTLADIQHRRHFVERPSCAFHPKYFGLCPDCDDIGGSFKSNWPAFFKACVNDTPINTTIHFINAAVDNMIDNGHPFELWIVSGRSDEVRKETEEWLAEHVGPWHTLLMRKAGDYTPDDQLKKSWLDNGIIPKDRVFCVFDDRDRVVQMWRKEGLICYQVADGDF